MSDVSQNRPLPPAMPPRRAETPSANGAPGSTPANVSKGPPPRPRETQPARGAPEAVAPSAPTPSEPFTERVPENIAGMLCYLFGWVGGMIFLVADRRPFVRYHAVQSVVVFATLSLLLLVLGGFLFATLLPGVAGLWLVLRRVVELVWIVAAVFLMLKAYSGERFRVPYAATYAEQAARGKP